MLVSIFALLFAALNTWLLTRQIDRTKSKLEKSILVLGSLLGLACLPSFAQDAHALRFQQFQLEGIRFLKASDYPRALENFEAALKEHSNSWQIVQNIAICHNQLGHFEKAVSYLQKSIEIGWLHASQCIVMAGALEGLGEPKKALSWLELACSVEPAQAADPIMQNRLRMLRDPMHCPTGALDSPNYISSLASIRKWRSKDLPLRVYLRKNIQIPDFYQEFQEIATDSLNQWCRATGNIISYTFVNDLDSANLVCDYTDHRELVSPDHEPGIAGNSNNRVRYDDNTTDWASVTVLVRDTPGAGPFRNRSIITSCFLHEVGHALGMNGHSPSKLDVMFYASTPAPVAKLSQRDIDTVSKIYQN